MIINNLNLIPFILPKTVEIFGQKIYLTLDKYNYSPVSVALLKSVYTNGGLLNILISIYSGESTIDLTKLVAIRRILVCFSDL